MDYLKKRNMKKENMIRRLIYFVKRRKIKEAVEPL
jgi:hypothetical protein